MKSLQKTQECPAVRFPEGSVNTTCGHFGAGVECQTCCWKAVSLLQQSLQKCPYATLRPQTPFQPILGCLVPNPPQACSEKWLWTECPTLVSWNFTGVCSDMFWACSSCLCGPETGSATCLMRSLSQFFSCWAECTACLGVTPLDKVPVFQVGVQTLQVWFPLWAEHIPAGKWSLRRKAWHECAQVE